jgi:3-phosphoglycerate kinase
VAKQTVRDLGQPRGERLFVRVDYNVPLEAARISDDTRIRARRRSSAWRPPPLVLASCSAGP